MGINVLSLFDGMSCGQIALERAGVEVDNYYASEIDKHAIKVCMANYPNTIQLGSVTEVQPWNLPQIDLLIGGSPCQGFSFAGKQLNFNDPRSALFFEFVRLLKQCQPKHFLLENVMMKKEYQDIISEHLGVQPIVINSNLVSAQNRKRLYWTNIPSVEQPKDRGVFLVDLVNPDKEYKKREIKNPSLSRRTPNYIQFDNSGKNYGSQDSRIYFLNGKCGTLLKSGSSVPHFESGSEDYCCRADREMMEQLQTVPIRYTSTVSEKHAQEMLGNGWTVDVIAHIFKSLPL